MALVMPPVDVFDPAPEHAMTDLARTLFAGWPIARITFEIERLDGDVTRYSAAIRGDGK